MFLLFVLVVIPTLLPLNAGAESISVIQRVLANQQPSSSGTVTISLSKATGAGHALIVGVSFWPVDISSVSDSSGDVFTRGIATSFYHNVSQGVMYTNFYYAKSTAGGATSITLHFSGGSTYVVAAISEVAGLDTSVPLDQSIYHESLSTTSPWSSASLTTSTANEYLFAWAADEWNNPSCSNPTTGWTLTQTNVGADLCLLDRTTSATGSYQVSVTPSSAFNYGMEIVAFKAAPPPSTAMTVVQRTTLNQQPSANGTITLTLPKATGAGHALIVGLSFWPLDIGSVSDSSGDIFTRGIAASTYHNVSQGVMYTNFYYAKSTTGGATSVTLHFSGGSTYVVAAVSEVSGLDTSAPLDQSVYQESLSTTSPWSSGSLTTSTANEYLFAWAADEWTNPSCSNATSGWTLSQNHSGATLCAMDRIVSASGTYQMAVMPSLGFNYAMELVGFKGAASSMGNTAPLSITTSNLPSGMVGSSYAATVTASGGSSPYTWSASGLPSGLSMNSAGTINGTPTFAATQMVAITAKDSSGGTASVSLGLTIDAPTVSISPTSPTTQGNNWYVSPSGADTSGCGSSSSPCATISHVSAYAAPGDTVHVSGSFHLNSNTCISTAASGTSSKPITYMGDPYGSAKIDGQGACFYIWHNTGNYVNIYGFDFTGVQTNGNTNGGTSVILSDGGGGNVNIAYNVVHDLPSGFATAIDMEPYSGGYTGAPCSVHDNLLYNLGYNGGLHQGDYGMYITCGTNSYVYNNLIYNEGSIGIHCWHAAHNVHIWNNTIANAQYIGITVGTGDEGAVSGAAFDVTNNVVVNSGYGIMAEDASPGSVSNSSIFRNNLIYNNSVDWYYNHNGSDNTLQGAGMSVTGTVVGNPLFVAPSAGNYQLGSGSPAIGKGINVGLSSDLAGNSLPLSTGVNIGAY